MFKTTKITARLKKFFCKEKEETPIERILNRGLPYLEKMFGLLPHKEPINRGNFPFTVDRTIKNLDDRIICMEGTIVYQSKTYNVQWDRNGVINDFIDGIEAPKHMCAPKEFDLVLIEEHKIDEKDKNQTDEMVDMSKRAEKALESWYDKDEDAVNHLMRISLLAKIDRTKYNCLIKELLRLCKKTKSNN